MKANITIGMIVGSIVGGYVPSIWGAGLLSYWGLFTSTAGGLLGIYIGYKLSE